MRPGFTIGPPRPGLQSAPSFGVEVGKFVADLGSRHGQLRHLTRIESGEPVPRPNAAKLVAPLRRSTSVVSRLMSRFARFVRATTQSADVLQICLAELPILAERTAETEVFQYRVP